MLNLDSLIMNPFGMFRPMFSTSGFGVEGLNMAM